MRFCRVPAARVQTRVPSRRILHVLAAVLLAGTAGAAERPQGHSNLVMRNDSPFAALIGVPGRWPDDSRQSIDVSFNISNHSIFRRGSEEFLLIDGETHRLQVRFQQQLHERIKLGISLPWLSHAGGFLDSTIDAWHGITGLREGIRPSRPRDELKYSYGRETFEIFGIDSSKSGLGDTQVGIAVDLRRPNALSGTSWIARVPVKLLLNAELPTGDLQRFTGNDHADYGVGLQIATPARSDGRLHWWLDFGVLWPGDVDVAGLPSKERAFYYDIALSWRWFRNFDLLLDVAGNSPLYKSELKALGDPAAQMAAGFVWHLANGNSIRAGFYEDLRAESATDFGVEFGVTIKRF